MSFIEHFIIFISKFTTNHNFKRITDSSNIKIFIYPFKNQQLKKKIQLKLQVLYSCF